MFSILSCVLGFTDLVLLALLHAYVLLSRVIHDCKSTGAPYPMHRLPLAPNVRAKLLVSAGRDPHNEDAFLMDQKDLRLCSKHVGAGKLQEEVAAMVQKGFMPVEKTARFRSKQSRTVPRPTDPERRRSAQYDASVTAMVSAAPRRHSGLVFEEKRRLVYIFVVVVVVVGLVLGLVVVDYRL